MTLRRYVVSPFRPAVGALVWLVVVASYNGVAAQVGHEPAHSPYHDVRRGGVFVFTFGYLGGSRGSVGVGPSDGKTAGIRYEVPFGAVGASLGLAYARMDRFVVDPFKDTTSRKTGPFTDDVVLLDAGLQLILTGRKSQSTLDSLLVVERHWSQIEAVVDTRPDGPWMYAVTEERLREIALS